MPSFDGQEIFGYQVVIVTSGEQRSSQVNSFFGIDGTERIDGGFRSRQTVVNGRLRGRHADGGLPALLDAINAFRNLQDGLSHVLVDSFGFGWNNVVMEDFQPSNIHTTPLEYFVTYAATFVHLSRQ